MCASRSSPPIKQSGRPDIFSSHRTSFQVVEKHGWRENEIDFYLHPSLNNVESRNGKHINEMCYKHGFEKGVPYCLATREDFNFKDPAQMFPSKCFERFALSKSEGTIYPDALLRKEIERKQVLRIFPEA